MSSGLNGHGHEVGTDHLLKARRAYAEHLFLSTSLAVPSQASDRIRKVLVWAPCFPDLGSNQNS